MKTKIITLSSKKTHDSKIKKASKILKEGGLVAFPTETVYGLGANALNEKAVSKIFIAKGRPQDNPLIVHISDVKQLNSLVDKIPKKANKLMEKFWPGPLTLIFKKSKMVPDVVTCGLDSVAIRMPENKIALNLIEKSGVPIAAPSANISGKPSPTTAEHVLEDLDGKINLIIDGGEVEIGLESTVLDLTKKTPQILRPGKVTKKQLEKVIGKVKDNGKSKKVKSPGMKYRHYSPNAKVLIIKTKEEIKKIHEKNRDKKIKILNYSDEITMAHNLFKDFRSCDKEGYDIILVKAPREKDLGFAIMNRLRKASCNENKIN
jgi:L-threonylcarbamoyladenylate synthase